MSHPDDVVRRLAAMIEKSGWAAQAVFRAAGSDGVGWTYTIGLHAATSQPELIVFGLPPLLAHAALTALANKARAGEELTTGRHYHDVLKGLSGDVAVELITVDPGFVGPAYSYFNVGLLMWAEHPPPVLQLLWPDAQDRLPTDPDFDAAMIARQPLLSGQARSDHEVSDTREPGPG